MANSTLDRLLGEVEQIGKDYETLVRRFKEFGYVFEQCVSYNEFVELKGRLATVLTEVEKLEDESDRNEVIHASETVSNAVDSTIFLKRYFSDK